MIIIYSLIFSIYLQQKQQGGREDLNLNSRLVNFPWEWEFSLKKIYKRAHF